MSSILETFYILFDSNAQQVKQGAKEAGAATKTLESEIAGADAAVIAAGEHIARVFENVAIRIASVFAIERVLGFIGSVSNLNAELLVTATRLGLNVSDLDAWGQAAERAGGTREGFAQTLDFLNRGIADIATKGTSRLKPFFDELKIKVTDAPHHVRPLLDILGDLSDKLSGLDAQQRAGIAEKLGIDEGTVLLLAQGRRGVEDLVERQRELGVVTQEDAEKAHAYKIALEDLEQQFRHGATELGSSLLPALADFFRAVQTTFNYLAQHTRLVEGFFIGVAGVVTAVYFPAMVEAIAVTWGFLAPILAVVAPILAVGVALALVTDDVKNFLEGNKSVIGELSKSWPELGETVHKAASSAGRAWDGFVNDLRASKDLIASILNLVNTAYSNSANSQQTSLNKMIADNDKAWPKMAAGVKSFNGDLDALGRAFAHLITGPIGWFLETLGLIPKAFEHYAEQINKVTVSLGGQPAALSFAGASAAAVNDQDPTTSILRRWAVQGPQAGFTLPPDTDAAQAVGQAQAAFKTVDLTPLSSIGGTSILNSHAGDRTLTINAPVTLNAPGADAPALAEEFGKHLDAQIRQAVDHFDNGVAG